MKQRAVRAVVVVAALAVACAFGFAAATSLGACSGTGGRPASARPAARRPAPAPASARPRESAPVEGPADRFGRECRAGIVRAREIMAAIVAVRRPRTVENTLVPYNEMLIANEASLATAGLLNNVHPDGGIRAAADRCEQEANGFEHALQLDRSLFDALAALDTTGMDPDTARLVAHALRDFRRAGVDKGGAARRRLKVIDDELVVLGQKFASNIASDVRHVALTSPSQLAGLPQDYIDSHKPDEKGEILISTDYPDLVPFLTYADSGELRRQLYVAFRARADRTNEPVLRRIIELRAEKVKLLGYPTWADYATEDKMMKSAANAARFIERTARTARRRAQRDHAELLRYKRRHIDGRASRVDEYERPYLENRVKAETYGFDAQEVRPYFPYEQVERGLLDITAEMYGLTYRPAADAPVWHADVRAFDVLRGDRTLGRIFLDMHPRPGKYPHAAQFILRSGVKGVQLPEGVLVCNFPDPRGGPALMEHDDVVTMFHEFGHLMHHVLGGEQRWLAQSGVATEWDFVEAPSQMFEEWAWSHDTLRRFARRHDTGAVIPEELVRRMEKARKVGLGLEVEQQMFYASISLRFHTVAPARLDMAAEVRRLQEKYTRFAFLPGTSFHTSFGHLYGYSALYYTYMWSLVIARDLLTPFRRHGLMDPEWTARYRDAILAPGGTRDAADLVRDFLGRDFSFKAFEDYLTRDSP